MKKKNSIALLFIILLLSFSCYAASIDRAGLIVDKRNDYVNVIPGQTFCVISIDAVSYAKETYTVDVPIMGNCTGAEKYVDGVGMIRK